MLDLRRECDAVLMGASTLRSFRKPCFAHSRPIPGHEPANVILSSSLSGISPTWDFFKNPALRRILVITGKLPVARRKQFEKSSEILQLKSVPSTKSVAKQVIEELRKRKINRLLVEGGGSVMWDFVSQNLIDEYHVTVTPRILGGTEAPTLVDGKGFLPKQVVNLKLSQSKIIGDEIYLVYRKSARRGG